MELVEALLDLMSAEELIAAERDWPDMHSHAGPNTSAFHTLQRAAADIDWFDMTLFCHLVDFRRDLTTHNLVKSLRYYQERTRRQQPTSTTQGHIECMVCLPWDRDIVEQLVSDGFDRQTGCGSLEARRTWDSDWIHVCLAVAPDLEAVTTIPELPGASGFCEDLRLADVVLLVLDLSMLVRLDTLGGINGVVANLMPWQRLVLGIMRRRDSREENVAEGEEEVERRLEKLRFATTLVVMAVRRLPDTQWSVCFVDEEGAVGGIPAWQRFLHLACNGVTPSYQRIRRLR